jgi:hypothetical protein
MFLNAGHVEPSVNLDPPKDTEQSLMSKKKNYGSELLSLLVNMAGTATARSLICLIRRAGKWAKMLCTLSGEKKG